MKPIYTIDVETDPFEHNRDPYPFAVGLYTGSEWYSTWGDDCIAKMHDIVRTLPPGIIYAHNGGKFDFFFMMDWIKDKKDILIINGRIVKAAGWRNDSSKDHELRDSYALMPFALKQYKKERIDYRCFERDQRNANKKQILSYLKKDCVYLHELCVEFADRFGDNITIASTSMKEFKKLYEFETLTELEDDMFRLPFYFGGRVQCFEKGIIKPTRGNTIKVYDINQAYPFAMRNFLHPISKPLPRVGTSITDQTFFLTVYGRNHGAFPLRTKAGLLFDVPRGKFSVSIHEYNAAIETGMFECEDVLDCYDFEQASTFDKFVDKFHHLRREAQLSGDDVGSLLYKYVGNSCYGKFAQNPDDYYNFMLTDDKTNLNPNGDPDGYYPCTIVEFANYILWRQPNMSVKRYNVATGASITGATRSLLIRALASAKRPLYCDTDSIICEELNGVPLDATKIGHWKLEKTGNKFAVGGRKLYTLFAPICPKCGGTKTRVQGACKKPEDRDDMFHEYGAVKLASKGVHLTPSEIVDVASGKEVTYKKDAPTFNFKTHTSSYITRRVKMT
jgi:hypothetical protein